MDILEIDIDIPTYTGEYPEGYVMPDENKVAFILEVTLPS